MPILYEWDLELDVDGVLRGQGADPGIIRARSPHLVETAARALEEGRSFLEPAVLYEELRVESRVHQRLHLAGGAALSGRPVARHLGPADKVIVLLCTIGDALETLASEVMMSQGVYGLALDGVGSAAVEALANSACRRFSAEAAVEEMQTTIPLSPGMAGWPVDEGQRQLFSLVDAGQIGVTLTENYLMIPRKSLSMVVGVGRHVDSTGRPCDYCSMVETCRYQHLPAP